MRLYTEEDVMLIANKMYGRGFARAELMIRSGSNIDELKLYIFNCGDGAKHGYTSLIEEKQNAQ